MSFEWLKLCIGRLNYCWFLDFYFCIFTIMKAFAKILVWFLVLLCVAWLTFLWWYYFKAKKILDYSVYCMDNVRSQLWEELEGVVLNDASCNYWACLFKWWVSYEWTDYSFSCNVSSEDNVAVDLQPLVIEKIEIDDTDEIAEVDTWELWL